MTASDWDILSGPAVEVAPRLLGSLLIRELDGQRLVGRIVETEAYDQTDAASHSYRGCTPRTEIMFGPAGFLYIYFTYGMHYCCNIVTGQSGEGSAVLVRAVEPLESIDVMRQRRRHLPDTSLTNGPAKVCQAFGIDKTLNAHDLRQPPFQLALQPATPADMITQTTRIGITQAKDSPWRFYLTDSPYISKKVSAY